MTTQRSPRILIVDEDEALTDLLSRAIELEGWTAHVAPTGGEALGAIVEFVPDIILLDVGLPDMAGLAVARFVRELHIDTPIVFLTGRASHEDRMAAYAAGGDDYVTKPFGLDELIDHLEPIVRRLGLAESSRRVGDLVVDTSTAQAWRDGEYLPLTPLEFEMLRTLVEQPGARMTIGQLLRRVAARGVRVRRELTAHLVRRMQDLVNRGRSALVLGDESAGWMLSAG